MFVCCGFAGVARPRIPRRATNAARCDIGAYQSPLPAQPRLSPGRVDVGSQPAGTTTTQTVTLTNAGVARLYLWDYGATGGIGEGGYVLLDHARSCHVSVAFTATPGVHAGTLTMLSAINLSGPTGRRRPRRLSGTGTGT